jgi:hypothetical protein
MRGRGLLAGRIEPADAAEEVEPAKPLIRITRFASHQDLSAVQLLSFDGPGFALGWLLQNL